MTDAASWQYLDPSQNVQGPFRASTVLAWRSICAEHGFNNELKVRSIKWTNMSWTSLADAQGELHAECGKPPGFSLSEQPKADAFAMFEDTSQPARNWFYVKDDAIMGPLQPSEMKAWASSSPEAMSTQVFCVTPDVPDAWAKRVEVGTALAATLAEHLDAASSGNTVAPWDLQEVRDSMIEHGHERDLAAPGGGSTQGRGVQSSPRGSGRQGGRGRRPQGTPTGRGGFAGSEAATRGGRGRRGGSRGRHADHPHDHTPPGYPHTMPDHGAGPHARDAAANMELQQRLMGMAAAVPQWDGQQMHMAAQGAMRGMVHDPSGHGHPGHAFLVPGTAGGRHGPGGLVAIPTGRGGPGRAGHSPAHIAPVTAADVQALAHNPRAVAMMQALAELHPSRPQFLHDQRQRQAPPPQSRGQQPPQPHTFHPHGPGVPDVRGQRPPLAGGGWAGRAPPGGAGDAAAAAQLPVQGGRDPGAARHSGGAAGGGTPAPQPLGGDGVPPQAKAEQEGGAAAGPPNWLDEGLSALQAKGATKTASGTFVFDGPSWASLAIDDPDASSS